MRGALGGASVTQGAAAAGAIRYSLTRLKRLRPYLSDGRLSIDNNAAERGMRSIAMTESFCTSFVSAWKH